MFDLEETYVFYYEHGPAYEKYAFGYGCGMYRITSHVFGQGAKYGNGVGDGHIYGNRMGDGYLDEIDGLSFNPSRFAVD